MTIQIYQDNTSPSIEDVVTIDGVPFDLTGSTVDFRMRDVRFTTLKVDTAATIVDAPNGEVRYDWVLADTDTGGNYRGWWHITLPTTAVQDTDEFDIKILTHSPNSNLCSIEDVRLQAEWISGDTSLDDKISELIGMASRQIAQTWQREFAPASTAVTRTFRVDDNNRVNLAPYDLRAATEVKLYVDTANPRTLSASEYDFRPSVSPDGVYGWLKLSSSVALWSNHQWNFGKSTISVKGDWGFAAVPEDVKRACVITVQSWLRRSDPKLIGGAAQAQLGYNSGGLAPQPGVTYSIPYSAQEILKPYRRFYGIV